MPAALAEWQALDGSIKETLRKLLHKRLDNPHVPGGALHGELAGCYKIKLLKQGVAWSTLSKTRFSLSWCSLSTNAQKALSTARQLPASPTRLANSRRTKAASKSFVPSPLAR